jgi:hypothetical protein
VPVARGNKEEESSREGKREGEQARERERDIGARKENSRARRWQLNIWLRQRRAGDARRRRHPMQYSRGEEKEC